MTIEVTDPMTLRLGQYLVKLMRWSNRIDAGEWDEAYAAYVGSAMESALTMLTILHIPYKIFWNNEGDRYVGVAVAGQTFYVGGGGEEDVG